MFYRNKQKDYLHRRSTLRIKSPPEVRNRHLVYVDCTVSKALVYISDTELLLAEGDESKCFWLRNETSEPLRMHLHARELPACFIVEQQDDQGEGRRIRLYSDAEKDGLVKYNEIDMYSSQTDEDFKEERRKFSSGQETTLWWQLGPGEKVTIKTMYNPAAAQDSVCADFVDLNLTVDGHAGLYNTIRLRGVSTKKNRLSISDSEVILLYFSVSDPLI